MTYAKLILLGYVGDAPKFKTQDENTIVSFSLAIHKKDRKTGEYTSEWYNCMAWNPPDVIKGMKKGQQVLVEGLPRIGEYEKDGHKFKTLGVLVDRFVLIGKEEKQ